MMCYRLDILVRWALPVVMAVAVAGCRKDELVIPSEQEGLPVDVVPGSKIAGMYLLNEGNMGSNKCTLDYLDFTTGIYSRNLYPERNPDVVKELGDVGNDIGIYGSKLYIVVNCSHKVEVLDSRSGIRIGQVDIPNCRYVRFHEGKAYVSSYVGPVTIDFNSPKGAVFEVDTLSLSVTRQVTVGYQPEEMEIAGDYMYVANSGGYRAPEFDNTLSVIRMKDFRQVKQIPVDINLNRVRKDKYGQLWVTSRGDYETRPSRLYILSEKNGKGMMEVDQMIPVACSNMAIKGDSIYYYSTEWSDVSGSNTVSYGIIDIPSRKVVSENFITDGTEKNIAVPYGIAIHPETGDIYLTDARNYVSSGILYCYSRDGRLKWSVRTGDIPAHLCFRYK